MERKTIEKASYSGASKASLLEGDSARYWLRSILAGMYLSIVVLVFWSLCHELSDKTIGKLLGSAFFGVGLSIIIFTNSELFTSNTMYMAISAQEKHTTWMQSIKVLAACYFGNLIGAVILALLIAGAGVLDALPVDHALYKGAVHKAHQSASIIFFKGILANWIVCLAVWVALRLDEVIAKLTAMILIVFIFLYLGFEHSIANMGTFSMSLLGHGALTIYDASFNLVFSTLGNIVGGALFVGLAHCYLNAEPEAVSLLTEPPASDNTRHRKLR